MLLDENSLCALFSALRSTYVQLARAENNKYGNFCPSFRALTDFHQT
ncbi:MAG: hypothetical protein J6A97_00210 [Clostridia bacterium]|nr:hypothetical protein [Clostridia bacterium]